MDSTVTQATDGDRGHNAVERALRQSEEMFRNIAAAAQDAIVVVDRFGAVLYWNPAAERMLGYSAKEASGMRVHECLTPERFRAATVPGLETFAKTGQGAAIGKTLELAALRKDGAEIPVELSLAAYQLAGQWQAIGIIRDITERKRAEALLREEDVKFRSLVEQNVAGVSMIGEDERLVYINPYFAALLGCTPQELMGRPLVEFIVDAEKAIISKSLRSQFSPQAGFVQIETQMQARGGARLDILVNATPGIHQGRPASIAVVMDITERKRTEQELQKSHILLEIAERIAHVAAWDWDIVQDRLMWSEELYRIYGRDPKDYLPTIPGFFASVHPEDRERLRDAVDSTLRDHRPFDIELRIVRPDGEVRFTHARAELTLDAAGRAVKMTGSSHDITDRKRAEQQILRLARQDALTGLSNRGVFVEALDRAITQTRRGGRNFAVLYLDLDHFKDINDTRGHPIGDLLLEEVAGRLRVTVRGTDTVARFGGDEFALIETDLRDPEDAAVLAEKLLKRVSEPFSIQGNEIRTGTSIGIAVYGPDSPDAEAILSQADVALYRAKSEGRGNYRFFTEAMDQEVRTRVTLAAELRSAIGAGQLFLLYQPQVDAPTERIVGLEALVRWQHPTRGVLLPGEFISIAEKSGLIVGVGHWVLREACRQMKQWMDAGIAPPLVAVNVSAVQFKTPMELETKIEAILRETGLTPERLELELTESTLMEASREHNETLVRLRRFGVRIAIDDFGTGYSSLDYLRRFPVDRIKIAQVFVRGLQEGGENAAIIRAAIGLAHELGIKAVAEGVETEQQLRLISSWGCRQAQGFYFSKPLAPEELRLVLRSGRVPKMVDRMQE